MILPAGTIHDYIKNLDLQQKWEQKKKSFEITQPKTTATSLLQLQIQSYNMGTIVGKLNNGKKLSAAEKEHLRKNNPNLYAKAVKIEKEREQYNRELSHCKTKDDVRRVHMQKMACFDSDLKTAQYSGDESASFGVQTRLMHISDEHNNFMRSNAYQKLHWENEEAIIKAKKEKAKRDRNKNITSPSLELRKDGTNLYVKLHLNQSGSNPVAVESVNPAQPFAVEDEGVKKQAEVRSKPLAPDKLNVLNHDSSQKRKRSSVKM